MPTRPTCTALAPTLALLGLAACGAPATTPSSADAAVAPDAAITPDGGAAPDAAVTSSCASVRLRDVAFDSLDDVSIRYAGAIEPGLGAALPDRFVFDVLHRLDFPDVTGTFPLGAGFNANFSGCTHCPLIFQDLFPDSPPAAIYYPNAGEVTLDVDPFSLRLRAHLRGLHFVEVTIGGELLESVPVPGGGCVDVEDLDVDYRFVPAEWTCAPEAFDDGTTCNCGCGAADLDCYPGIGVTVGCSADQACVEDTCVDRCSAFPPEERCATGLCAFTEWGDLCSDDTSRVDPAPLGGVCSSLDALYCAVEAGLPRGLCDGFARADQVCKPVCRTDADCTAGDRLSCLTVATERGFCEQRFPEGWTCRADQWEDGLSCDCGCGVPDAIDCQSDLPLVGCASDQGCSLAGTCVPRPGNDRCADAVHLALGGAGTSTTVLGTTEGAGHELEVGPGVGRCLEGEQLGPEVFYALDLQAGQGVNVELRTAWDGALYLLGPDASTAACARPVERCVAGSDSARRGAAEQLSFTAERAGTYTLVVDAYWRTERGPFELELHVR